MTRQAFWIAVASAEHVRRGLAQGFMQVSHGKEAPLKRVRPGDGIVYYSPTEVLGVKDGLQSFIAIGAKDFRFDRQGHGSQDLERRTLI